MKLDIQHLRKVFPLLDKSDNEVTYFDNAATTLKPISVIKKIVEVYEEYPSNVHRGAHRLADRATSEFEQSRELVKGFIYAKDKREIIFTKGTTEGINLVAYSFGGAYIGKGDEVLVTRMEHHANIVPWKMLCERVGATLKMAPITDEGELDLKAMEALVTPRTRLIAVAFASNSLGTVNPISHIVALARSCGAKILVDAAQAIAHIPIDVQALDIDFLCFSGHKMFGPFGVGVVYGKKALLEAMAPYQGGGGMIKHVSCDSITYAGVPTRFEAGTPSIASVIGLGEAIRFINHVGRDTIYLREKKLTTRMIEGIKSVRGVRLFGQSPNGCPTNSFCMDHVHPHDLNSFLDMKGFALRAGHHCNQPLMDYFQVPATNRFSLSYYNSLDEVDSFIETLKEAQRFFA